MLHESKEFKDTVRLLDLLYISHAVLGEYPRDRLSGETPKHLNIHVLDCNSPQVKSVNRHLQGMLDILGTPLLPTKQLYFVGAGHCISCYDITEHISLVFWEEPTLKDILDRFDYNVNQCVLSSAGEGFYLGDKLYELEQVAGHVQGCEDGVYVIAYSRAAEAAKQAGWAYRDNGGHTQPVLIVNNDNN